MQYTRRSGFTAALAGALLLGCVAPPAADEATVSIPSVTARADGLAVAWEIVEGPEGAAHLVRGGEDLLTISAQGPDTAVLRTPAGLEAAISTASAYEDARALPAEIRGVLTAFNTDLALFVREELAREPQEEIGAGERSDSTARSRTAPDFCSEFLADLSTRAATRIGGLAGLAYGLIRIVFFVVVPVAGVGLLLASASASERAQVCREVLVEAPDATSCFSAPGPSLGVPYRGWSLFLPVLRFPLALDRVNASCNTAPNPDPSGERFAKVVIATADDRRVVYQLGVSQGARSAVLPLDLAITEAARAAGRYCAFAVGYGRSDALTVLGRPNVCWTQDAEARGIRAIQPPYEFARF